MKSGFFIALKVAALTVIMFILYGVAAGAAGLEGASPPPEQGGNTAFLLLLVCLLNTVILTCIILRSRWTGLKLIAAIFVAFYGVTTVMSQIESAIFITQLPPGTVPRLFLMGAIIAAPFAIFSVLILRRRRSDTVQEEPSGENISSAGEWAWKLGLIVIAYLVLYFSFGYFIAWQSPAVREYYGGTDHGSFFASMRDLAATTPWLFGFQAFRALMWTAIAFPVIRMLKGSRFETALWIALLFSVVMNTQLLLPNPYMPEAVRFAHLVETASSNFIFGFLVGWLLSRSNSTEHSGIEQLEAA
jgi:hypothetical protein